MRSRSWLGFDRFGKAAGSVRKRGLRYSAARAAAVLFGALLPAATMWAANKPSPIPNIFAPTSTPAEMESSLGWFVVSITMAILVVVGGLWAYATVKYRQKGESDQEPAQVYGSPQVELAWTIIPVIIVVVMFLTTARVIFAVQDHPEPKNALEVTVVGHQFWWEYRYPQYGVVAANELHVPMSTSDRPRPTFMKLLSADVWHSWWVPQLSGKVDNIPDHVNEMWIDPHVPGVYVGQCSQFCGVEHAKMLIRVYVDTPDQFQRWITNQQQPATEQPESPEGNAGQGGQTAAATLPGGGSFQTVAASSTSQSTVSQKALDAAQSQIALGKQVFLQNSCINCHAVQGTNANGRFGPNLTHFGSRDTLGSGAIDSNLQNVKAWIRNPDDLKEGALMPPMQLDEEQLEQVSLYLKSLK